MGQGKTYYVITPRCLDHYELRCTDPKCEDRYHPGSATFDGSNLHLLPEDEN